jgi:hypothetical protein
MPGLATAPDESGFQTPFKGTLRGLSLFARFKDRRAGTFLVTWSVPASERGDPRRAD